MSGTFNMTGHGQQVAPQTVQSGKTAFKPSSNPTETGWVFRGWYADSAFKKTYNFKTPVTSDITIYARWTQNGTTPITGDDSNLTLWLALMALGACGFAGTVSWDRRRRKG